jgi:homocysteine S-methyltransferase
MVKSSRFVDYLASKKCVILDGALATELERRGCNLNSALWSAEILVNNPQLIYETHLEYFEAGADVVITASYQASVAGFQKQGLSASQAVDAFTTSVRLAKQARTEIYHQDEARQCFIAGSIGPYGAYLADGSEYRGDYKLSKADMMEFHRPRMKTLIGAEVDVLACETIPSFEEAEAILSLLQEFPDTIAWLSFTLRDLEHISDGTPLSKVAEAINKSDQIIAIGVNCVSSDLLNGALQCLSASTTKPLVVYPNSGEKYDFVSKTWIGPARKDDSLVEKALQWHKIGARLIGGCCRTTPADIHAIKSALSTSS